MLRMRSCAMTLIAVSILATPLGAQSVSAPSSSTAGIDAEIRAVEAGLLPVVIVAGDPHPLRSLVEEMRQRHVPAVSIAVVHDGTIRWAHAWGTIDPERNVPAGPDTLFQPASISKSLASMAALHLVQEHKLWLDAPAGTELKSWILPQNSFTAQKPVTLRELLSHTAGTNVHGFQDMRRLLRSQPLSKCWTE